VEAISLRDVGGMGRMSGWDQHGNQWMECWGDCRECRADCGIRNCVLIQCSICGKRITTSTPGWICLGTGETRCEEHIEY
jgi:hypothetical protein